MRRLLARALRGLASLVAGLVAFAAIALLIAALLITVDHAPMPAETAILNPARLPIESAYDVMGRSVSPEEAEALGRAPEGRTLLAPSSGAIRVDESLVRAGREIFYRETFGNEFFFSDVLGVLDGGLTPLRFLFAISDLTGRGTSNLQVRLGRDVRIGDRLWKAGELISTGLDVPRGEIVPLGIRAFYDGGRVRVGVTCALCHATYDPASGKVVEGAPNRDLNAGLLMALAANPAASWPQTGLLSLDGHRTRPESFVRKSTAGTDLLPDPESLATTLRGMLAAWPPGSVDTTGDLISNPTSIPAAFTRENWPYGWSGQATIGPFRGLSAVSDMVHGLGSDATALAPSAELLFGIDPEVYLGTLLQAAPDAGFRFDPSTGGKPSEVFAASDPTPGTPGVNRFVVMPGNVRANYVTAHGLIPSRPGDTAGYALYALAAFQNRLRPPEAATSPAGRDVPSRATVELGQRVFDRAGCLACHSGPALTSQRVWPAEVLGTEPTRAKAFANREPNVARPQIFAPDTRVPLPAEPLLVPVPVPDEGQLKLAWGHNQTQGGYKVPGLVGLAWTAPYLHDGGVAVGPDPERRAGIAATVAAGIPADPRNSLRALVDRSLREPVVASNRATLRTRPVRVTGEGHAFWVDREAGFSEAEREALITYLLSIDRLQPLPAADAPRESPPSDALPPRPAARPRR